MDKTKRRPFTNKEIKLVFNKTGGVCYYCGVDFPSDTVFLDDGGKIISSKRNWHIDHVTPVSKGGTYDLENLVPSCSTCNFKKGDK